LLKVYFEGSDEGGLSEEIGSVVHAIKLEILIDNLSVLILFLVLLDLYSELEAQFVKPFEVVLLPHKLMESSPFNFDVGHVLILNPNMKEKY